MHSCERHANYRKIANCNRQMSHLSRAKASFDSLVAEPWRFRKQRRLRYRMKPCRHDARATCVARANNLSVP